MANIHDKLDHIVDKINKIEVSQARTEVIMDEHIMRTELAEENLNILRAEIQPLKTHVNFINWTARIVAVLAGAVLFLKQLGLWDKLIRFLLP